MLCFVILLMLLTDRCELCEQYADWFMTGVRTSVNGLTMMLIPRTDEGEYERILCPEAVVGIS